MHLDPDGLRATAALVARVLDGLCPLPPDHDIVEGLRGLPDGPALAAEHARLLTAVERVTAELTSMYSTMCATAATVEAADLDLARALRASADR